MILVDGYNVLFHDRYRGDREEEPLARRRGRLLARLAGLATRGRRRVSVVFDGDAVVPEDGRRVVLGGVEVRFSPPGEDADSEIVRIVEASADPGGIEVVTDDGELRRRVRLLGSKVRASGPLAEEISRNQSAAPAQRSEKPGTRDTGMGKSDWISYFGFEEEDLAVRLDGGEGLLPGKLRTKLRRKKEIERESRGRSPEPLSGPEDSRLSQEAVRAWLEYFGMGPGPRPR
ncbi:MAG: NYN domain-containing protein [Planctomycetes bacterium]|nr:NYN domain-containing protein [Planctomycetota bacterium]